MSSDNGIYILETTGPEYRVAYAQAIDNLNFGSEDLGEEFDAYEVVKYFGQAKVYTDKNEAWVAASSLHDNCGYTEYGVCLIKADQSFQYYLDNQQRHRDILQAKYPKVM